MAARAYSASDAVKAPAELIGLLGAPQTVELGSRQLADDGI
jgi:hypothetical protein